MEDIKAEIEKLQQAKNKLEQELKEREMMLKNLKPSPDDITNEYLDKMNAKKTVVYTNYQKVRTDLQF